MDADYDGYGNSRIRIIGKNNKTIFYYDNETYTQAGSQVSKTTYYDKNKNKTGSRITSYSNGGKKVNRNYYDKYGNHILNEKIEIDKNGNSTKVYTDENGNQITDEKEIQRRKSMVEPQDKDYKKYKKDEKEYFDTISKY